MNFELRAIGRVESPLRDLDAAPRQADEGAPAAWLVFEPDVMEGLRDLRTNQEVVLLTWLDRARRDVLSVLGLHRVEITRIEGGRIEVRSLEAMDGTPILDVKPILSEDIEQR